MSVPTNPAGGSSTTPSGGDYNPLLERFHRPDVNKVTGLLAYALYKVAKREWATEQWDARQRRPTPDEMTAYTATWTKSLVDAKLAEAESMLVAYAEAVIRDATPAIREDALRGTFWSDVRTDIFVAFVYTLLLIGAATILHYSGVDFDEITSKVKADHSATATDKATAKPPAPIGTPSADK